jgi:acetyl esterase/lipase
MKRTRLAFVALLLLAGCVRQGATTTPSAPIDDPAPRPGKDPQEDKISLVDARRNFRTKLVHEDHGGDPPPQPPAELFRVVRYDSPAGKLSAYLSQVPGDGAKRPAIIWITGGDCNTIDQSCWIEGSSGNDPSASAFRKAGIVMMFPSLRGGNDNPGPREGFFGEVDDVLAAAEYLAKQDFVDSKRIYLGGHDTGGTLVFLVAASSDKFRAVFSFGPVADMAGYKPDEYDPPFDTTNPRELELRSPARWVHSVRCPLFVFEGTEQPGHAAALKTLSRGDNPMVRCFSVKGANHHSVLPPVTRLAAAKILRDGGPTINISFTEKELNGLFVK